MGSVPFWVWPNAAMLTLVGGYRWWRLVYGTTRPGSTSRRVGTVAAIVVILLGPIALIGQYALPMGAQRAIGWPGWLGYALVVFLATATLLTEPVRIWWWWRRRKAAAAVRDPSPGIPPTDAPNRRLFLQRLLAAGIGGVAVGLTGVAARSAVGGPAVRAAAITIPGLPPEAVGMRIAVVSDLHLG